MRNLPKITLVMTVLCAGAYGLHRMQPPSPPPTTGATVVAPRLVIPDVAPAGASAVAHGAAPSQRDSALIYPDRTSAELLHLGYEVFTRNADGSMMALPLPPGTAWRTMIVLQPTGHRRLVLAPLQPECAFAVAVEIHRPDRAATAWHAQLPAHSAPTRQVVDLSTLPGSGPLLLSLAMADGADNSWSCNVALSWDDSP